MRHIISRAAFFVIFCLSAPWLFAHKDVEPKDSVEAANWIQESLRDFSGVKVTDFFVVYTWNNQGYGITLPRVSNVSFTEQRQDIRPYCVSWQDYALDAPPRICWGYKGHKNAERFAAALEYLSAVARQKTQAEVDADWAHFQKQVKLWQEANPKPAMPEAAHEHQVLAEYAFKEKNTEKAMFEYGEALKVFSTWPDGQFNLATLCGEAKRYQCAVLHMKEYLELSPDSPDAQAAKDSMIVWKDKLSAFENAVSAARQ